MKINVKVILVFLTFVLTGCAESSFTLSQDSRLPKWFEVPEGMSRKELKVTMDYYVYPSNRIAIFKLYKNESLFPLKKVTGKQFGNRPYSLNEAPPGLPKNYPLYEIITVDGITDVIEHRKREPIFYTTDDPAENN